MQLRERMARFVAKADQLAEEPLLLNNGLNTSFSLNYRSGRGMTMESIEPDERDLRSALMLVRQFVMDKETINIDRIYNLLDQHIRSDELKGKVRAARQAWKKSQRESWLNMEHDDKRVTPTFMADLWINGHYFHSDAEKDDSLRRLVGEGALFARHVFLGYVSNTIGQILYLRNVIRYALDEDLFG